MFIHYFVLVYHRIPLKKQVWGSDETNMKKILDEHICKVFYLLLF